MAQTTATRSNEVANPTTATANNEVVAKSSTADKGTTLRVVETRDMWTLVFDQTATLLALAVRGEALPKDAQDRLAFGKQTDAEGKVTRIAAKQQPNIRPYFCSLLAAFGSKKGYKHAKGTDLANVNLEEVAQAVFTAVWAKGDFANKVGKAEPKQAKSLIAAVIAKL